ncbi:MAG TPA: hypothetical protein VEC16_04570 [Alphaproteobacteria bacterium]|nr:hypothetical protein [Alphaproteobacteria bacterium]
MHREEAADILHDIASYRQEGRDTIMYLNTVLAGSSDYIIENSFQSHPQKEALKGFVELRKTQIKKEITTALIAHYNIHSSIYTIKDWMLTDPPEFNPKYKEHIDRWNNQKTNRLLSAVSASVAEIASFYEFGSEDLEHGFIYFSIGAVLALSSIMSHKRAEVYSNQPPVKHFRKKLSAYNSLEENVRSSIDILGKYSKKGLNALNALELSFSGNIPHAYENNIREYSQKLSALNENFKPIINSLDEGKRLGSTTIYELKYMPKLFISKYFGSADTEKNRKQAIEEIETLYHKDTSNLDF